ncbi:MAG: DUF2478 domain-containing protein [Chloroflexi bacterium]|nr:DUF2478 domain-containing protein [Chloroflexota bacterium]
MINAVLTGPIHIGKTTICQKVIALVRERGYTVRGILTPPIVAKDGTRLGLAIVDVATGEQYCLARTDVDLGGPRVGMYSFDPRALAWGQARVERAVDSRCDLLIVDEVGRLELESSQGFLVVFPILRAGIFSRTLIVVRETLLDHLQTRLPEVNFTCFKATVNNRNTLPQTIVQRMFLP